MDVKNYLENSKLMVEEALDHYLPPEGTFPPQIYRAMRYSIFAGGKRLRPILVVAGSETVGGRGKDTLPVACAIELIHTFSLIHDDLPAMDNDDYRRGKASSHKVFGEALAILTGDALITEAFQLMTNRDLISHLNPNQIIEIVNEVATAAGHSGMIGGQVMDMESEGQKIEPSILEYIHTRKTGALIMVSVRVGAKLGGGNEQEVSLLSDYGEKLGLAFQIRDDISDAREKDGKWGLEAGGGDLKGKKATYPAIFGMKKSKKMLTELIETAVSILKPFDRKADPLREIANYLLDGKS